MSNYSGFIAYNSNVGVIKNRVPVIKQDKSLVVVDSPVEIDQDTGAMSGNIMDVVTITASSYALSADDAGKQLYFTFAGAVTVTIPGAASQNPGVFWMYAAGPSTTLTLSKATGGDTLLGATAVAATESGTIVLRSGTIYENDPRFQTAGPGAGTVTSVNLTSTGGTITPTGGPVTTSGSINVDLPALVSATGAAASPLIINGRRFAATFTSVSIAADASLALTITNSAITGSGTVVRYSLIGATGGSALSLVSSVQSAGQSVVTITNGTGATTSVANILLVGEVMN